MRRLLYSLAGAAVLLVGVFGSVAVPTPAYANGLLSVCISASRSLLPKGTCIDVPPSAGGSAAPGRTYGRATADYDPPNSKFGEGLDLQFEGQITIGGQTFVGTAAVSSIRFDGIQVHTSTLSGTSATGSLTATCTGVFAQNGQSVVPPGSGFGAVGGAVSRLDCDGSANEGPVGHVTLVSAYRASDADFFGGVIYDGAFAGY